jgi:hypothetical protein
MTCWLENCLNWQLPQQAEVQFVLGQGSQGSNGGGRKVAVVEF